MVEAYEHNELADNPADEKRMEKAKKEAERTERERSEESCLQAERSWSRKGCPVGSLQKEQRAWLDFPLSRPQQGRRL